MKKKKYRLKTVLEVRERAKTDAANFLALCREQLANEKTELKRRENVLEECRETQRKANELMFKDVTDGTKAQNIVAHRTYLSDLKDLESQLIESVHQQEQQVQKAKEAVEQATENLISASKEVQVIEKHKENWIENEKQSDKKREQKMSDEIGAILYQSSKKLS